MLNSIRTIRNVVLLLTLGISFILFSGCAIPPNKSAVSVIYAPNNSPLLKKSDAEGIPRPPGSEPVAVQVPVKEPEPILKPEPEMIHDESDPNPSPEPEQGSSLTPIHPFWELNGNPPTAPGLAMRQRVFDPEPPKIAYITIDDGPHPETTPKILKILKEEKIHATFFVVGQQVESYPQLLKEEFEQGNAIGNHTYSHNYRIIYSSPDAFLADVKKNEEIIYNVIGIHTHILRAPGGTQGHFNVKYYNAVDKADYMVYDWNSSMEDATAHLVPADQLVRNIEKQAQGKDRLIILMHDIGTKITSVEALPRIIQYLKKEGYVFGVLTPRVAPIVFSGGFRS